MKMLTSTLLLPPLCCYLHSLHIAHNLCLTVQLSPEGRGRKTKHLSTAATSFISPPLLRHTVPKPQQTRVHNRRPGEGGDQKGSRVVSRARKSSEVPPPPFSLAADAFSYEPKDVKSSRPPPPPPPPRYLSQPARRRTSRSFGGNSAVSDGWQEKGEEEGGDCELLKATRRE